MKNRHYKNIILCLMLVTSVFSCDEGDHTTSTNNILINNSGVDVKIVEFYSPSPETLSIAKNKSYNEVVFVDGTGTAILFYSDSIEVIFNTSKKQLYRWLDTSIRNPLHEENYEKHQISEYKYEMYYTFTEQDYLDADSIK